MDPNACLQRLGRAILNEDNEETRHAAGDLCRWIQRGGFKPDWSAEPLATAYYCGRFGDANVKAGTA